MLSSDHGGSSLDSVMTSSNSPCAGPGDHHLLASQYSPLQASFPLAAAGTSSTPNFRASSAPMPEWPYSRDDSWVFEPSEGMSSTRATNLRSNIVGVQQSLNPPGDGRGLLQRFHSAPSNLLEQCLEDFSEDAFTLASSAPLGDRDDDLLTWADNLMPIIERGPQQMDIETLTEEGGASSSLDGCSEQFLVSQTDFERTIPTISTISTPAQNFGEVEPRPLTHRDGPGGGYGAMPAIQDNMAGSRPTPSFQMASFLSPAESMSGTSEEKYGGGNSTMSSAYLAPEHQISYQLGIEPGAASGSGLWNCPTRPGMLEGNRLARGMGEIMTHNEPPGWLGSTRARLNVGGAPEEAPKLPGLIRHSSLPGTSWRPFCATVDSDDFSRSAPRANRGHATHPRSIAERVRRGKISERMKKLQDLVPSMERQSNTADMLDEVVEYVRQLQLQVQELSNTVVRLQEGLLLSGDH